jgi:lysophospholipase L1-like esterase
MRKFSDDRCEFIIDSDYGRTTSEAVEVLSKMSAALSSKNPSDTHYVIALGTNDGSQESSYREKFASVLRSIPEKSRVYWVTTFRSAPLYSQFRAVSSLAASSGRVYVLDWASQLLANPSILKSDGVHLTEGGYRFRSDFVKTHTCDSPPS